MCVFCLLIVNIMFVESLVVYYNCMFVVITESIQIPGGLDIFVRDKSTSRHPSCHRETGRVVLSD